MQPATYQMWSVHDLSQTDDPFLCSTYSLSMPRSLQETAGLKTSGSCREGAFTVLKDTECQQDTKKDIHIFLNSRNWDLEMPSLCNSNWNTENLPAVLLSAKLQGSESAPSVILFPEQIVAQPSSLLSLLAALLGLHPKAPPLASVPKGSPGMKAMDRQAAATEALLQDTSNKVFACKLGVTSDPSLHLEMLLQAVLQGCWSCVCVKHIQGQ